MNEKKMFAKWINEGDLNIVLKRLQENGAEIVNVYPCYGGTGYTDGDFDFRTNFTVLYKSNDEIDTRSEWEKESDGDCPF